MRLGSLPAALLLAFLNCSAWLRAVGAANDLRETYYWKMVDFAWPDNETMARDFPHYRQEENIPLGLEVAGNRLFVTVPRWKQGAAASLTYINTEAPGKSPPLIPYPSWEAHRYKDNEPPEIVSTFRIRADRCSRLWVLDTGLVDILGNPDQQAPPALIVYDLSTDKMLRKYPIPADQRTPDSLFANIAVEDYSCEDSYAYLGDLGGPGLVVYSWKSGKSWLVKHHYFHPDPQGGEFNVSGIAFQWTDGLFGMALAPTNDGYSTMYFHPLSSTMEFAVSTKLLRDPERANLPESFHEFRVLGSRGRNGQSSVSFLDPKTGILFYALTNLNSLACWRTDSEYTAANQGLVHTDNVTMIFPNDLKIDSTGTLWILTDRLPTFMYSQLDPEEYNFRILSGPANSIIRDTVCDVHHEMRNHEHNAMHNHDHNTMHEHDHNTMHEHDHNTMHDENAISKNGVVPEIRGRVGGSSGASSLTSALLSLTIISIFLRNAA